jgi:hypothetical protein
MQMPPGAAGYDPCGRPSHRSMRRRTKMGIFKFEGGMEIKPAPDDAIPKCPFCKEELREIWIKTKGSGFLEQKQVIMCPQCRAFLGYGSYSVG